MNLSNLAGLVSNAVDQVLKPITPSPPTPPHTGLAPKATSVAETTDSPCVVSFAASSAPTNVQTFLDLPESSPKDVVAFFARHQDQAATTMVRSGASYVLAVGGETIKMNHRVLADALTQGHLSPKSPLGVSLLVFDVASRSRLPQGAIRTILSQMTQSMAAGQSPQTALRQGYHNVILATQVEAYVRHKDGLATDSRRIGQFSDDARQGKLGAGHEAGSAVATHQTKLDGALHRFCTAYSQAQESGEYASAFDSLQEVFRTGSASTGLPYWQTRGDSLATSLALPERDDGPSAEILDSLKKALSLAVDAETQGGLFASGGFDVDMSDTLRAQRKQLLGLWKPRNEEASPPPVQGARAAAAEATLLAERDDHALQRTFQDIADGFSRWEASHASHNDFQTDYTQSTIEYLLLLDRFADGLEALKEEREPRHTGASLPPDAVDQPAVLASFIETIANRLAAASTPEPNAPIAESLRAMIAALRTAS